MGLVEKAAVVMVVSISSQIVCDQCMPRNHLKYSLQSNVNKSQNDKRMKKDDFCNISTPSEAIRFPNVEYPLDTDLGEYYRFLNEYPMQCKPKEYKTSCQVQTKYKRKFDKIANAKAKPQIPASISESHPDPLRFFPEVEYPLSARDMWIPNESRLQDVKRNRIGETDRQADQIPSKNIVDPDYENVCLNTLIKSLNTKKAQVTETPNPNINVLLSNTNKSGDILDETILNTTSALNIDNDSVKVPLQNETISTLITTEIENAIPSTTLTRKLTRPIDNISTECSGLTEPNPSTNIFTPLDYYDSTPSMVPDKGYSNLTDATTAVPPECATSPMSSSGTVTDDIVLDQSTTTTPNPILTTNSPLSITSAQALPNSDHDYSIIANGSPQNVLDTYQGNFTKNSTFTPNDFYPTCQLLPEDSDDWVIYVDTEKSFSSQENFSDYTMTGDEDISFTYFDTFNYCLGERPQISTSVNSTLISEPGALGDETNQSQVVPKNMKNDCPVLNITNSVKTITETGNVDISPSLFSCYLNENNENSCARSASSSTQTEDGQPRENSTYTSIIVPAVDDTLFMSYGTENTAQSVAGNEYEPVYFTKESDTIEEPKLEANEAMDQVLYFDNSNSTLQYEYIDDTSASYTEMPYDFIL